MPEKYKICYLETSQQIGGGQVGLLDILKNLDYDRFDPWIILQSKGPFYDKLQEIKNVKICLTKFIYLPKKISEREQLPIYSPFSVRILRQKLNEIQPHLVHSNHLNVGRYGSKAAFLNKVPNIVTFRCIYHKRKFNYGRFVENRILTYSDNVVFNSIRGAEILKERSLKRNILSIINGVDLTKFSKSSPSTNVYQEFGIPENRKIFLLPARIYPDKGHQILIRAAAQLLITNPDLHIVFLGDEDHLFKGVKDQFNSEAIDLGLSKNISWIKYTDNIVPFFKNAFCVVLPSFFEGCPRVLLESLAAGTPIIGSQIDGINEIIKEGINGFGFKTKDSEHLSFTMQRLLSLSDEQYLNMKQQCLTIAENEYDLKQMIAKYQNLYLKLINNFNR